MYILRDGYKKNKQLSLPNMFSRYLFTAINPPNLGEEFNVNSSSFIESMVQQTMNFDTIKTKPVFACHQLKAPTMGTRTAGDPVPMVLSTFRASG
jgi:hypothetical protein